MIETPLPHSKLVRYYHLSMSVPQDENRTQSSATGSRSPLNHTSSSTDDFPPLRRQPRRHPLSSEHDTRASEDRFAVQPPRSPSRGQQRAQNTLAASIDSQDWQFRRGPTTTHVPRSGSPEEYENSVSDRESGPRRYSDTYPAGPGGVESRDRAIPISRPASNDDQHSQDGSGRITEQRHHRRSFMSHRRTSADGTSEADPLSRSLARMTVGQIPGMLPEEGRATRPEGSGGRVSGGTPDDDSSASSESETGSPMDTTRRARRFTNGSRPFF